MSQWSLPLSPSIKFDFNNKSEITITEEHNHRPQSWPYYTLYEKKEHDRDQQQQKQKQQQHYSYCHSSSQLKNNNNNNVFSLLFQDTWSLSSLSEEDNDFMYDEDNNNKNEKEKDLSAYVFPLPPDNNHDLMDSKFFSSLLCSTIINNNNKNKESMISIPPPFSSSSLSSPPSSPPLPIHIKPIPTFHTQSLLFLFGFLFFPCWWIGWYLGSKYRHHHNNQVYQYPPQYENNVHMWSSDSFYNEIQCYSKFNRILSIVSFFLILFIIALIVWYYVGIGKKWW